MKGIRPKSPLTKSFLKSQLSHRSTRLLCVSTDSSIADIPTTAADSAGDEGRGERNRRGESYTNSQNSGEDLHSGPWRVRAIAVQRCCSTLGMGIRVTEWPAPLPCRFKNTTHRPLVLHFTPVPMVAARWCGGVAFRAVPERQKLLLIGRFAYMFNFVWFIASSTCDVIIQSRACVKVLECSPVSLKHIVCIKLEYLR